jgi:hypothetical protein
MDDSDNKLVLKNKEIFKILHEKKGIKITNPEGQKNLIIVPVTINICINSKKYKIDFLKYSKYMIDILNDGFSGKIHSPYKNIENEPNFLYSSNYIKNILDNNLITNSEKKANIIYNAINKKTDTNIRFYLDSIVYHDTFIETTYENKDIESFIEMINKKGFKPLEKHHKHLNINIIKFNCQTLGVSTFPWIKYVTKKVSGCMQVFLDFCSIHPDIANNRFNKCKTLIHEVGHIFGLKHIFSCNKETLQVYSILLGKIIFEKEMLVKINSTNAKDLKQSKNENKHNKNSYKTDEPIIKNDLIFINKELMHDKIDIQLYSDIPAQINATNYNPFENNIFPFHNDIPNNFSCFMDYSPDDVLTHFTESQINIMHYMIRIFKPYLIKKTNENNKLNNCKVKLYINSKDKINNNFLLSLLTDNNSKKYYVNYDNKNNFKYSLSNIDDKLNKFIYRDK